MINTLVIIGIILVVSIVGVFLISMIWALIDTHHFNVVQQNYFKLMDAIHLYRVDMYARGVQPEVSYEDLIDISKAFDRFWDYGYKRLLPPDKYEKIKKYIED